jgi:hydrogenase maturation protease
VAALRRDGLPHGLRAEDGGQDALRLAGLWRGEPRIWLVDAFARGAPPGTIHRLEHEDVLALPQRHATAHRLSLPECLRWLAHAFPRLARVRYRLWGVEPSRLELREALSPPVQSAIARLCDRLRSELSDARPPRRLAS